MRLHKFKILAFLALLALLTAAGHSFAAAENGKGISAPAEPGKPSAESNGNGTLGLYDSFQSEGDIRRFDGETLSYNISFLWFDNAATATVSFYKLNGNGDYQALLVAETKGFVGWFTAYRKHLYRATFEIIDNGRRARTKKFEREVIIGGNVEKTLNLLDYNAMTHSWDGFRNGVSYKKGTEDIPPGVIFDDILAAFYNFRNGVYGKVEKGAGFKIHTIPEKGMTSMLVEVKNDAEADRLRLEQKREKRDELLLRVVIPKEVFKTKTGELLFWGSKNLIPLETTVVGYLVLGDLHATFVKREVAPSPSSAGPSAALPASPTTGSK